MKPPARQRRPGVPPDPQKGRPRPLQEPKMDPKGHPKTPTTHHSATPGLQNGDQGSKNSILDRLNGQRLVGSRARVQKRREPSLSGPHRMLSGPHRMLSGLQDAVWAAQNAGQNAIRATESVSGPHRMLSGPQACNLGHKECVWTLSSCLWPLAPRRDARSALNYSSFLGVRGGCVCVPWTAICVTQTASVWPRHRFVWPRLCATQTT